MAAPRVRHITGRAAPIAMVLVLAISLALGGCADNNDRAESESFPALTGREVISATRATGSARARIETQEDLTIKAQYDFAGNRALLRWVFPSSDLFEEEMPPVRVEVRAIDATAYVRDGSWLCPGCGIAGDEPLPTDEWIPVPVGEGDKAFDYAGGDVLTGGLGWLELIESPVKPSEVVEIDGESMGVYEVQLPATDVEHASPNLELQGETVTVEFTVDHAMRLRRLLVAFRADDRDNTIRISVGDFGVPVSVQVPPADEIFTESS